MFGQAAEPGDQLAALPIAADPLQFGRPGPGGGDFGRRSQLDGRIAARFEQTLHDFGTRIVEFDAGRPPALRPPVRIEVPGGYFVEREGGHIHAANLCVGLHLGKEDGWNIRTTLQVGFGQQGGNRVAVQSGRRPAVSQGQKVSADSATEIGDRFTGGKPGRLVCGNEAIGRLLQADPRKEHPIGSGEFHAGAAAEFHLLENQPCPRGREGFAESVRLDHQRAGVGGGPVEPTSRLVSDQPAVIVQFLLCRVCHLSVLMPRQ